MRPELLAVDPLNRLVARQMPLRFSSDQVRDAALSVSAVVYCNAGSVDQACFRLSLMLFQKKAFRRC